MLCSYVYTKLYNRGYRFYVGATCGFCLHFYVIIDKKVYNKNRCDDEIDQQNNRNRYFRLQDGNFYIIHYSVLAAQHPKDGKGSAKKRLFRVDRSFPTHMTQYHHFLYRHFQQHAKLLYISETEGY